MSGEAPEEAYGGFETEPYPPPTDWVEVWKEMWPILIPIVAMLLIPPVFFLVAR